MEEQITAKGDRDPLARLAGASELQVVVGQGVGRFGFGLRLRVGLRFGRGRVADHRDCDRGRAARCLHALVDRCRLGTAEHREQRGQTRKPQPSCGGHSRSITSRTIAANGPRRSCYACAHVAGDQPDFDGPPLLGDITGDAAGPPAVSSADPLVGCVLADRYLILGTLGDGGMGSVYMAEQTTLGKSVALKVLKPEFNRDAGLVERFFREARATAAIRHENVIDILDFGQTADYAFFAMEALSGCELADIAGRGRRLDWDRSKAIIIQVVRALAAAHAAGIIHRDMKPQNVFLIQRGKTSDFVKVLDFGIAKIDDGVQLTQAGMVFGTAAYMAPEQATGAGVDGRTDIYAVGCMLFEMLTGRLPFNGDNFMKVLAQHIREPAPRLRDV